MRMNVLAVILLGTLVIGCSDDVPEPEVASSESDGIYTRADGPDPEREPEVVSPASHGVYARANDRLVVYIPIAGDADNVLTGASRSKMDNGQTIGRPWVRLEVPSGGGLFDLAAGDGSSFRAEASSPHPYGADSVVPILLDFKSGQPGLSGTLEMAQTASGVNVKFNVHFKGNYTLFPDIGPKWFEFTVSERAILVTEEAP